MLGGRARNRRILDRLDTLGRVSLYGRIFAAAYDRMQSGVERAGLAERRAQLLAGARGRVLELGAGTGANIRHYPDALQELVLSEPEEPMARRLERRLAELGRPSTRVVRAPAESLPFEDSSFDTVVATLVLCTVKDPGLALAEVDRVLKPGGRLLFLEHVRSEDPRLARWQDRLHGVWIRFGHGCNCNRPTPELIRRSPLEIEEISHAELPKAPPIVRPLATGRAVAR
jgi:ubiquinone/menaquinone biosynthesis C-methylase UbiE